MCSVSGRTEWRPAIISTDTVGPEIVFSSTFDAQRLPPTKLTILDELGAAVLNNVVGPYRENADINLTCISSGGQPAPKVTWWREHALLDDSYLVLPDGTVKNVLYLEKLSRHDLHTTDDIVRFQGTSFGVSKDD
uniref:Ig-like domain-containing protein n=1 Tax=Anopheles maculatus TaxID=74869 RepID=A0A182SR31_9DIPT